METVGLILLAAGASTRLGQPKQQLPYRGKTLLEHALAAACASGCKPLILVLGAHTNQLVTGLPTRDVVIVNNPDWQEGMAASVRSGLAALLQTDPAVAGVILLLCDQPFVSGNLLRKLIIRKAETRQPIIACSYQDTLGTPVLFDKTFFPELRALRGPQGAKKLIYAHPEAVAAVPFPLGYIDIDTPADYAALPQTPGEEEAETNA